MTEQKVEEVSTVAVSGDVVNIYCVKCRKHQPHTNPELKKVTWTNKNTGKENKRCAYDEKCPKCGIMTKKFVADPNKKAAVVEAEKKD